MLPDGLEHGAGRSGEEAGDHRTSGTAGGHGAVYRQLDGLRGREARGLRSARISWLRTQLRLRRAN